ncbi:MAG: response regulator [Bacteroidia bacterium]|nr:response regulator [Bacteroidia bacterium]
MKPEKQPVPFTILLADDDSDDCSFFEEALAKFPIPTQLTFVHDGEQLMKLLTKENTQLPDVLFLDLNMPRKNGFECLSEIRLNRKLDHLIVIMYSTSLEPEVVNQLYKNGAQYFIRKPSEFSEFKRIIQQAITRLTQNLTNEKQGSFPQPDRENFVLTVQNDLIS